MAAKTDCGHTNSHGKHPYETEAYTIEMCDGVLKDK